MRANHNDSKYVFHWQRYAKEFVIKLWHYANLVSANDMAVIREPEHAISTGVHAHNPSLGFIRFKYCHRCIRSWLENCENNSFCQFICRYSRIEPRNIPLWTTCGDACPRNRTWNRINSTNQKPSWWLPEICAHNTADAHNTTT